MKKRWRNSLLAGMMALSLLSGCAYEESERVASPENPQCIGIYEIAVYGYHMRRDIIGRSYYIVDMEIRNISRNRSVFYEDEVADGIREIWLDDGEECGSPYADRRSKRSVPHSRGQKIREINGDPDDSDDSGVIIMPGETVARTLKFPVCKGWKRTDEDKIMLTIEGNMNGGGEWKSGTVEFTVYKVHSCLWKKIQDFLTWDWAD